MSVKPVQLKRQKQKSKEVELGSLPEDWDVVGLGELLQEVNIKARNLETDIGKLPILSMTRYKGLILQAEKFGKRVAGKNIENYKVVKKSNVVCGFPMDEGVIYALREFTIGLVSPTYFVWELVNENVDIDFLDTLLKTPRLISIYKMLSSKTVRRRRIVRKGDFKGIRVPIPPFSEQQKIVAILSVVDDTIHQTDEVIEKSEMLKRGLMQRLLTQGIGHTKFKQTELGEIPTNWDIVRVGDVCKIIIPGRNKPRKFDGNIPWISLPDLEGMYVSSSKSGLRVSVEEIKKCGNKIIPRNSVIMSCVGKFGIVAINTQDLVINQQLHAFVCPKDMDPYFLAIALMSQKKYMLKTSTKTIVPYLNKEKCNSIPIPLPSFEEQKEISKIFSYVDKKIENEKRIFSKLQKLKEGLMQVLLTGKVRVKVD